MIGFLKVPRQGTRRLEERTIPVSDASARYRRSLAGPEGSNLGWNMYGEGLESLGRDGAPESIPIEETGPGQLLVRVDAVGMCFSDVKLIKQGASHPKLYGRNLETNPTRLGHEAAVTVIEVGDDLLDDYEPGQRLAIQPDIYVEGRSNAYGYTIPGGFVQYHLIGPEILDADDGAYVIPVHDSVGHAAAALSEPWACVIAAYTQRRRLEPKPSGTMWIIGDPDDATEYQFSNGLDAPARIILSDVPDQVSTLVESRRSKQAEVVVRDGLAPGEFMKLDDELGDGGFDDVVLLGVTAADVVSAASNLIGFRGTMNLVGTEPLDGHPEIDVGRIHYEYTAYVGTSSSDIAAAYGEDRNRCELKPGGVAVFVGAGGPMGQMHVQRALELEDGPQVIVASDIDGARLETLRERLSGLAEKKGCSLVIINSAEDPNAVHRAVADVTNGDGADDVVVTVPLASVIEEAGSLLRPDGMMVLFAGVPNGTRVPLDLSAVFLGNTQLTGTSGSTISDQSYLLDRTIDGSLSPQRSLAAVGGIEAARDGIEAMMSGRFAGKIVIFPHLENLPLTGLDELGEAYPNIGAQLADHAWTTEAESELIATFWAG